MKKVFLHVGKHKTGTTSIQSFLSYNRETLLETGFYPVTNIEILNLLGCGYEQANETNNVTMSHILIRPQLRTPLRFFRDDPFIEHDRKLLTTKMNCFLKSIDAKNIIISAESFSFLRCADEKSLYVNLFDGLEIIPIIFLREKRSWMNSWKIQTSSLFHSTDVRKNSVADHESILNYSDNSWLLDDESIVKFFEGSHIIHYEMAVRKFETVVLAFIDFLGLKPEIFERVDFFEHLSANKPDLPHSWLGKWKSWISGKFA